MSGKEIKKKNLKELQEIINYNFKNEKLLKAALTTPQLGKEKNIPDYEILETLGDAIIKLIFILKKIKEGAKDPGEITKTKQKLENDEILSIIAEKYFNLEKFVIKSQKQKIQGTRILADVFEAINGALYLDSENVSLIEKKIINKFYDDWDIIVKDSTVFNKNKLLEYIQKKYRTTPTIIPEFTNYGSDHQPKWIAKSPKILDHENRILIPLQANLKSKESKSKKEAEKDLYIKILNYLKKMDLKG